MSFQSYTGAIVVGPSTQSALEGVFNVTAARAIAYGGNVVTDNSASDVTDNQGDDVTQT